MPENARHASHDAHDAQSIARVVRVVAVQVLALWALTGCVTFERPRGEWATALDLNVPADALAGMTVGVDCASGDADDAGHAGATRSGIFEGCRQVAKLVKGLGAEVRAAAGLLPETRDAPPEEEHAADDTPLPPPDFTLRYIDLGGHRDYGGWTLPASILTFDLFPVIEDIQSRAELQIRDHNGLLFARYPLRLDLVKVYGAAALYYIAVNAIDPSRRRERNGRIAASMLRYVGDVLYTYRRRLVLSPHAAEAAR